MPVQLGPPTPMRHVCLTWTGMALASIIYIYGGKTASLFPSKRTSRCWQVNIHLSFFISFFAWISICYFTNHVIIRLVGAGWGKALPIITRTRGSKGAQWAKGPQGAQREPRDRCWAFAPLGPIQNWQRLASTFRGIWTPLSNYPQNPRNRTFPSSSPSSSCFRGTQPKSARCQRQQGHGMCVVSSDRALCTYMHRCILVSSGISIIDPRPNCCPSNKARADSTTLYLYCSFHI